LFQKHHSVRFEATGEDDENGSWSDSSPQTSGAVVTLPRWQSVSRTFHGVGSGRLLSNLAGRSLLSDGLDLQYGPRTSDSFKLRFLGFRSLLLGRWFFGVPCGWTLFEPGMLLAVGGGTGAKFDTAN